MSSSLQYLLHFMSFWNITKTQHVYVTNFRTSYTGPLLEQVQFQQGPACDQQHIFHSRKCLSFREMTNSYVTMGTAYNECVTAHCHRSIFQSLNTVQHDW